MLIWKSVLKCLAVNYFFSISNDCVDFLDPSEVSDVKQSQVFGVQQNT